MNKRQHQEYEARRKLQAGGWQVGQTDKIAFNGGSETNRHMVAKSQVGWYLSYNGWRIDSEVPNEKETAFADIIAYGNGEPPFIVECETGITSEIREQKLDQFYYMEPFSEVFLVEVNDMPEDRAEQLAWINDQLPGEV